MLSSITLKRIAELVHTYLAELFTPAMVNDIQGRIRNDFPCNLYQDYRNQAAEADSKMDLANMLKRDYDDLKLTSDMRLAEARNNLAITMTDLEKVANALSDREMEVCQLKAKLYDLEHK